MGHMLDQAVAGATSPENVAVLPVTIEEVTPQWLTIALAARHPGITVTAAHVEQILWGTGTKIQLRLDYDEAGQRAGLPPTLWVKGGFAADREFVAAMGVYATEVRFYRDVLPQLDLRTPQCFFAGDDPAHLQSIVILEDLLARNVNFGRVVQPISYAQAAANLDAQARLHARWWNSPALDSGHFGRLCVPLAIETCAHMERQLQPETWAHYVGLPRGAALPRLAHDRVRIEQALLQLRELNTQGPMSLLHGDAHMGNMYFEQDGTPGFLDWQTLCRGPWAHDFTYFLVSALDIADRRRWDRALLGYYLARLAAYGVSEPPSFDQAWLAYRQQIVYGLFYWMTNPVEWQSEVNNTAVASRFGMAAADLDTLAAIG